MVVIKGLDPARLAQSLKSGRHALMSSRSQKLLQPGVSRKFRTSSLEAVVRDESGVQVHKDPIVNSNRNLFIAERV